MAIPCCNADGGVESSSLSSSSVMPRLLINIPAIKIIVVMVKISGFIGYLLFLAHQVFDGMP